MKADKAQNIYLIGVALAAFLFLGMPVPASAFPQNGNAASQSQTLPPKGATILAVTGKVVETTDGGGYTFALVDKDGNQTWVAMPKTKLVVGDEINCRPGMVMHNFPSKSLNRVFPSIVFSSGVEVTSHAAGSEEEATKEAEAPPAPKPPENWKNF